MRQGITVHITVKLGYLYSFAMMLVGFVLFFLVGTRDDSIGSIIWAAEGLTVGLLGLVAAVATTILWVLLDGQFVGGAPKVPHRRVPINHEEG